MSGGVQRSREKPVAKITVYHTISGARTSTGNGVERLLRIDYRRLLTIGNRDREMEMKGGVGS
jgi:hypothetical protein